MDMDTELRDLVAKLLLADVDAFLTGQKALAELDIDSLEFFELINEIESRFQIELSEADIDGLTYFHDLEKLVVRRRAEEISVRSSS